MKTKKAEITFLFVIMFTATILYMTGMPLCIFDINVQNKDIPISNIFYIVNMLFLSIAVILITKIAIKGWKFGLTSNNLLKNLVENGKVFFAGIIIVLFLNIFIYKPLNRMPTAGEIIVWVLISNFFIAIIEELLLRGLLLKAFEKIFIKNIMMAVIVASAIFGIGHIPGMIQEDILSIAIRVIGTIAVGISLSLIYIKTNNLWTVIILHFLLNVMGSGIYYFSNSNDVYSIARIWPIPMIIVCVINFMTIKISDKNNETSKRI